MRVPSCTPSAPSARAAAIVGPSTNPPAAITGTSTLETTSGRSTIVDTGRGLLKPPPSPPSTMRPSTPASTAFSAPVRLGTTWKTVRPASLSGTRVLHRAAGRRGHELHALLGHELHDRRIAHEGLGDVHAERLVGEVAHLADLVPDDVELARRGLDDPHGAGVRHGAGELGAGDPAHRGLHDRDVDTEQLGDTVGEGGGHGRHPARALRSRRCGPPERSPRQSAQMWSSWPRVSVPVTRPRSWRSMAPVAPHTVSPSSSKKKIGRSSAHGNVQRLLAEDGRVEELGHRDVQHGRHLLRVGDGVRARRRARPRTGR